MRKVLSWVVLLPLIICWTAAYFLSGEPEETIRVSNYSQFINGNRNRNFIVEFDEHGYTSFVKKKGNNITGFYEYLTKNDTSILVFDDIGGGKIDSTAFLIYSGYENDPKLVEEIDTSSFFLSDINGHLAFKVITGKDDLLNKNENLVIALIFLPLLAYYIGFNIYGFILWMKKQK